ncbi:alpha/beta hydrolase [Nocardia sp. NBC_01499]|uniref:alpha/beta fold hydrolase n=1 Tax=Nocardia sp. NBC_01499 TaxID=2903597 RepID=UPI003863F6EC
MSDPIASRARQIARSDVVLHGEEAGAGPTVLLLHAGGERRQVWRPVIGVLVDAGFRCVAFDQRGHGDSDGSLNALAPCAADVAAMVDAEPQGCVVVGNSLGGLAALGDPAVRARVAGLVLVDIVPNLAPDRVRRHLGDVGMLGRYPEFTDDTFAQTPRLRQIATELDLPVLLVRGGRSPLTDDDVDGLLRLAPQTTVTRIPGAGHLVARDQPVALAETIAAHATEWARIDTL